MTECIGWQRPPSWEGPIWTTELGVDIQVSLAMRDGEVTLIQAAFDTDENVTPVLTLSTRDAATGVQLDSVPVDIHDPDDEIDTGLVCTDWASRSTLVCGRAGAAPAIVSVESGSFDVLPGEPGAIPAVVRPA